MEILAGTAKGLFVFGDDERIELEGEKVTSLAGDYAITDEAVLWRNGERVASFDGRRAQCLLAGEPLYVGADEANLLRIADGAVTVDEAFANAPARDEWYTPWGGPPDVRSITRARDGMLYVNVHVGGVLRLDDGEWTPTLEIDADVHQVLADPDDASTVYAASARGFGVTRDGGHSWHFTYAGTHGRYMRSVAVAGDHILVGVASDYRGIDGALYRTDRAVDGRFEQVGPPNVKGHVDTHALDARGSDAAFGTHDGAVWASRDAGGTWERIAEGLPEVNCVSLRESPGR